MTELGSPGSVSERIDAGYPLRIGEVLSPDGHVVKLAPVPGRWLGHDPGRMGVWLGHYMAGCDSIRLPDLLQLMWADATGRFPDDPGCDAEVVAMQPVLATDPYSLPPADESGYR